jgi:hypothetical protein
LLAAHQPASQWVARGFDSGFENARKAASMLCASAARRRATAAPTPGNHGKRGGHVVVPFGFHFLKPKMDPSLEIAIRHDELTGSVSWTRTPDDL